jgi:hypothetical protein
VRSWLPFALILVAATLLRLPGIEWGFGVEPGRFHALHPDEGVSCFELWTHGRAWLTDPANWHERGMQVQCWGLAALLRGVVGDRASLETFVRAARVYSIVWGLIGIVVVALVAREIEPDRETREHSARFAALLCAFAGVHIVTSFWARGQIQNNACFFASVYCAQRTLRDRSRIRWLFAAGVAAGIAIVLRWSVALLPMLAIAAWAAPPRTRSFAAAALGCVLGASAGTAFVWTPAQIDTFVRTQTHAMLLVERGAGPIAVGAAAIFCTIVGCGLATAVLGIGGLVRRGATARFEVTPALLLLVPVVVQLAMIATIKSFEARHTDLLSTALVIFAGVELAHLTARVPTPRTAAALVVAVVAYQAVYAWGVVTRFRHDTRNDLAASVASTISPAAPVFVSWYVPRDALVHAGVAVTDDRGAAAYVVAHEQHTLRYLGRSGTFLFLGAPASCREIYNCWTDEEREFYQELYRDPTRVLRRLPAATWTPELILYRRLMGSKWMFTADLVIATAPPL